VGAIVSHDAGGVWVGKRLQFLAHGRWKWIVRRFRELAAVILSLGALSGASHHDLV